MHITILTLFPDMFTGPFDSSIIGRARKDNNVTIDLVNIRDFALDSYKSVDDHPYGGGAGMIMRVDILDRALEHAKSLRNTSNPRSILLNPSGKTFTQSDAKRLTTYDDLIFICGHYEGVDDRFRNLVDEELSIGDYVLTGGELPAMVICDCLVRLLPHVLHNSDSSVTESFSLQTKEGTSLLEYPQYTRPPEYKGMNVPEVLLSGNHKEIRYWQKQEAMKRTKKMRPDLL